MSASSFADFLHPIQRRTVLNYLVASKGFEMGDGLLMSVLADDGLAVKSREDLHAIEDWLAERDLIEVRMPPRDSESAVRILAITPKGLDVAQGIEEVPGIQRATRKVSERMRAIVNGLEDV